MARPRTFSTPAAVRAARDTFWRQGYEATTLTDLTDAMRISRPSLYNAFGDKEKLFLTVLDEYVSEYTPALEAMAGEPNGRVAVETFLVDAARGLARGPGCLRVGHTAMAGSHSPVIADALVRRHREFEGAFESRLVRAQRDRQLDAGEDPAALATFFAGIVSAMAVQSRVGADEDELVGMARRAMRAWKQLG